MNDTQNVIGGSSTQMQAYLQFLAATAEESSKEMQVDGDDHDSHLESKEASFQQKDSKHNRQPSPESPTSSKKGNWDSTFEYSTNTAENLPSKIRELLKLDDNDTGQNVIVYYGWLITDVLLQGKIYLTSDTLLFVAPVEVDSSRIIHSGNLSRKRESFLRKDLVRSWFVLRHEIFCWYANLDEIYFPEGFVHLTNIKTAEVRADSKDSTGFDLKLIDGSRIRLQADSHYSAYIWVRELKREIFRCSTRGNNAIICLPFENIKTTREYDYLGLTHAVEIEICPKPGLQSLFKYNFGVSNRPQFENNIDSEGPTYANDVLRQIEKGKTHTITREVYDTTPIQLELRGDLDQMMKKTDISNDFGRVDDNSDSKGEIFLKDLSSRVRNNVHKDTPSANDFRKYFGLPENTKLLRTVESLIHRGIAIPHSGLLYITNVFLCYRRKSGIEDTMVMPLVDIEKVEQHISIIVGHSGISITTKSLKHDLWFELNSAEMAKVLECLQRAVQNRRSQEDSIDRKDSLVPTEKQFVEQSMKSARLFTLVGEYSVVNPTMVPPIIFDPSLTDLAGLSNAKLLKPLNITMLTIGSRGDVQPYIALSLGLQAEGHKCRIVTHGEFEDWVKGFGIDFKPIAGNPADLMKIMISHGGFTMSFIKDAAPKFTGWLRELLETAWKAVKDDTDVLIESPSAMAGIHIAEALKIPYFRTFTMPWTQTRKYPQAFIVPDHDMGGTYNYSTYSIFNNMLWMGISRQVNHWRQKTLGLPSTSLEDLRQQDVPFMYCVSPIVLVPPIDEPDWIDYTGYWFLDTKMDIPNSALVDFVDNSRRVNKKIVYIGFGSIVVDDPEKMTKIIVDAVENANVNCVLARGWSRRGSKEKDSGGEIKSKYIFEVNQVSHAWLFPRIDAAVHHGGSGTTGASLRAGLPTIIKPFFGDQFFYGRRVAEMGVGFNLKSSLHTNSLCKALVDATTDERIIDRAKLMGSRIRSELGVKNAIALLYLQMPYAKRVTESRAQNTGKSIFGMSSLETFVEKDTKGPIKDLVKSLGSDVFKLHFLKSKQSKAPVSVGGEQHK